MFGIWDLDFKMLVLLNIFANQNLQSIHAGLFRFFMNSMLLAPLTMFFKLYSVFNYLFILFGMIINPVTFRAF